jgi:hypothetical protein
MFTQNALSYELAKVSNEADFLDSGFDSDERR